MKATFKKILPYFALLYGLGAYAQDAATAAQAPDTRVEQPLETASPMDVETAPTPPEPPRFEAPRDWRRGRRGNEIVSIGRDSNLPEGEKAEAVVSIMGSSTSAGEVSGGVVSILGNTRVTGPVGDAAVAVLGNTYVNSKVDDNVVAVLGDVELGPEAEVGGDVVAVGGGVTRDPQAIVRGNVNNVSIGEKFRFGWLRPWIDHALLYGRPLSLASGLAWAWWLAFAFLALYVLLALMFRDGVNRSLQTLEAQPGRSILAALLTVLLTPIAFVLLFVTVIGIAAVPFLGISLFCAGVFGKAVMLAWIGRRCTRPLNFNEGPLAHPAFAVLVGGVIVMALYLVPVLGFIVYKLLGILGLGVVVYTLILSIKDKREDHRAPAAAAAGAAPGVASGIAPEPTVSAHADEAASAPSAAATNDTAQSAAASAAAEASMATTALPRAGFWIRMAALLLDLILVAIVAGIMHISDVLLILLAAYGAVMWKFKGATIGGVICHLQIVRLDGREIDWATAIVRALSCFISLVVAGLGFFWIAFDDERQSWHDKIAGTVVVRVPKGVSLL